MKGREGGREGSNRSPAELSNQKATSSTALVDSCARLISYHTVFKKPQKWASQPLVRSRNDSDSTNGSRDGTVSSGCPTSPSTFLFLFYFFVSPNTRLASDCNCRDITSVRFNLLAGSGGCSAPRHARWLLVPATFHPLDPTTPWNNHLALVVFLFLYFATTIWQRSDAHTHRHALWNHLTASLSSPSTLPLSPPVWFLVVKVTFASHGVLSLCCIYKHIPVASFVELCGLRNVLFAMFETVFFRESILILPYF